MTLKIRRAEARSELAKLDRRRYSLDVRRDHLAKEIDDLTDEINIAEMGSAWAEFQGEVEKLKFQGIETI